MDDDSLKALKCCQHTECLLCPLSEYGVHCKKKLIKTVVNLIETLKDENENLRHCINMMMEE